MATQITLPKDAEGKEVPLDTKLLYDEYGNQRHITQFIYHHDCETGAEKWIVEYDNGVERFVSVMYLTPPDSWEKLEEDLDRCIAENNACMYYSTDGTCQNCAILGTSGACTPKILENILDRIRKLRNKG